jgi:hypothetical protein
MEMPRGWARTCKTLRRSAHCLNAAGAQLVSTVEHGDASRLGEDLPLLPDCHARARACGACAQPSVEMPRGWARTCRYCLTVTRRHGRERVCAVKHRDAPRGWAPASSNITARSFDRGDGPPPPTRAGGNKATTHRRPTSRTATRPGGTGEMKRMPNIMQQTQ